MNIKRRIISFWKNYGRTLLQGTMVMILVLYLYHFLHSISLKPYNLGLLKIRNYEDYFDYVIKFLYAPAVCVPLLMKLEPPVSGFLSGGSRKSQGYGYTSSGEQIYMSIDLPDNTDYSRNDITLSEAEEYLIFGWFLGLTAFIYNTLYGTWIIYGKAAGGGTAVKPASDAVWHNWEIILATASAILMLVVFFGFPVLCLRMIQRYELKNKFYAVFFALPAAYFFINYNSIVQWLLK